MKANRKVLFINKSAASHDLAQSKGLEKSRIFSHVQSQRSSSIAARHDLDPSKTPAQLTSTGRRKQRYIQQGGNEERSYHTRSSGASNASGVIVAAIPESPRPINTASTEGYLSLLNHLYGGAVMARIFPTKPMIIASQNQVLTLSSQDAVLYNAFMFTVASAAAAFTGKPEDQHSAVYYQGLTIKNLRKTLASDNGERLQASGVFAISFLVWSECLTGSAEAASAHAIGLEYLAAQSSSISRAPLSFTVNVLGNTYWCAAMTRSRPQLKPVTLDTVTTAQHLSPETRQRATYGPTSMASSFFASSNAQVLGPRLVSIIDRQRLYLSFKQSIHHDVTEPVQEDMEYLFASQLAVEYELLSLPFEELSASLTPAQDAVRLALFMFTQPMTAMSSSALFTRSMAGQLKAKLEQSRISTFWNPAPELLLWVLFVGTHISKASMEWSWFVAHVSLVLEALDVQSSQQMKQVLGGFFYFDEYFEQTVDGLWNIHQPCNVTV